MGVVQLQGWTKILSTLIRDGDDDIEVISVQVEIGGIPIRIIVGYGPQENEKIEKKRNFWNFVENEIHEAELNDHGIILQMDGNLHAGELVKNDPNPQNKNGKLFMDFLDQNRSLVVTNCLNTCEGVITRKRVLENRTEEAVLDFFLINEKLRPFFEKLIIDEERKFCLSNVAQIKKNKRIIETDHNAMIAEINLKVDRRRPVREEMLNLRNKECQKAFKEATDENPELLNCFNNNLPFDVQSKRWLKRLNYLLHSSFKKVRIVNNKTKKHVKIKSLLQKRIKAKQELKPINISEEMRQKIEERIVQIEKEMENEVTEEYQKHMIETLRELSSEDNGPNGDRRKKMWKLLKKYYPKIETAVPVGKKDGKGNIITNHVGLKRLYLQTYVNRLRNRPINPDFEEIKKIKMELFNLRFELSKSKKKVNLGPWNILKGL